MRWAASARAWSSGRYITDTVRTALAWVCTIAGVTLDEPGSSTRKLVMPGTLFGVRRRGAGAHLAARDVAGAEADELAVGRRDLPACAVDRDDVRVLVEPDRERRLHVEEEPLQGLRLGLVGRRLAGVLAVLGAARDVAPPELEVAVEVDLVRVLRVFIATPSGFIVSISHRSMPFGVGIVRQQLRDVDPLLLVAVDRCR